MVRVMVNGLPGKMATEVANLVARSTGMTLHDFSFTGGYIEQRSVLVRGFPFAGVLLLKPDDREQ